MKLPTHTAEGRLVIDLQNLPSEGREFAGSINRDLFQLENGGPRPLSSLDYDFRVERRSGWLIVTGTVGARFELDCVRCTEPFPEQITLDGYLLEQELEEKTLAVDLTDRIREDILLALPGYPHCDQSNLIEKDCPAAGRFLPDSSYAPQETEEELLARRRKNWGALDQLHLDSEESRRKFDH